MCFLRTTLIAGIFSIVMEGAVKAESPSGVWMAKLSDSEVFAIKFLENSGDLCGVLYWMNEPKKDGNWKIDKDNPNASLRERRILGISILGRLQRTSSTLRGRIYLPDLGSVAARIGLATLACDVKIDVSDAQAEASVSGGFRCGLLQTLKGPLTMRRQEHPPSGPTAGDSVCAYEE
jgi:hypothetical protein